MALREWEGARGWCRLNGDLDLHSITPYPAGIATSRGLTDDSKKTFDAVTFL